jgi:hypothetical protein
MLQKRMMAYLRSPSVQLTQYPPPTTGTLAEAFGLLHTLLAEVSHLRDSVASVEEIRTIAEVEQDHRMNEQYTQLASLKSDFSAQNTSVRNLEEVLIQKVRAKADKESEYDIRRDPAPGKRKKDRKKYQQPAPCGEISDTDASEEEHDSNAGPMMGNAFPLCPVIHLARPSLV